MDKDSIQEALVSNFAGLLGAKSQGAQETPNGVATFTGVTSSSSSDDFNECLSEDLGSSDIVCTIPCMEMKIDSKKVALPEVGDHFHQPKPEMAASVLNASQDNYENASTLEKEAGKSLGTITSWTKSTLVYAPQAASKSISTSFSGLVASRVRAWTLLLLRHSLTTGDAASRARLLSMLSSNIEIRSTQNSFKTLPLPDSAKMQPKEADVILPLLFECSLQIVVQGRNDAVFLRAPGTIAGHFSKGSSPGLIKVDVRLDTNSLLESMVEQARLVVFKAVARATSVGMDRTKIKEQVAFTTPSQNISTSSNVHRKNESMSSFSSALNLSADAVAQSPQLQKARSSALRLNSILQGKSSNGNGPSMALKLRNSRSVQWDGGLDSGLGNSHPPAKRQRVVQSQARLRSFKSFGRPHGGEGREAKNATFGDFGRSPTGPVWGRDGKLLNHPSPGLPSRLSNLAQESSVSVSNKNATFDAPPKRMKRTATALESWLVKNATGR